MTEKKNIKVIISGGGTGGHIFPAIAIADALKRKDENIDILFVGAKDKIEMEKVPKAGYPIEGLWISGFHRKLTLRNLLFPFKLMSSLWKSVRILNRFQPNAVVGVGGFASGPVLEMAARKGIPVLIQEQNSYAGVTNKLLAKKARTICVSYDKMDRYFPVDKLVHTGNPVRADILDLKGKKAKAYQHFGLNPQKKTIIIVGGSLGARTLNDSMGANTALLKANNDIQVLWQAGKLYIDEFEQSETAQLPNVQISAFIDKMDLAYAMADVLICRAGALTISELSLAGKAAVLVPSPNVAEDHQTKNAMALVEKEAAILVHDATAKAQMIPAALNLLKDNTLKDQIETNVLAMAQPNAANKIAEQVLKLIAL